MSYPDTPDGQRGTVNGELVLAVVNGGTASVTVALPTTCKALWILTGPIPDPTLTVIGAQSGIIYPAYPLWTQDAAGELNLSVVAFVTSEIDVSVTIHWTSAPTAAWTVIADNGARFVLDAALAASAANPGTLAPLYAVQVAGTDGTDLRPLSTDSTGALKVVGSSFPPVYAAVGGAQPADVLQIGGANGGDLFALLADATGRLLVVEQALELCIAAANALVPANAVQIGGSDGTRLRAMSVDSAGHPQTIDQRLIAATVAPGGANPGFGVAVGGTDGTDLRVLRTNEAGIPYAIPSAPATAASDHPPNELKVATFTVATGATLLAAPGAGLRYRIFYATATVFSTLAATGSVAYMTDGASPFLGVVGETRGPFTTAVPLSGVPMAANTAITFTTIGGAAFDIVGSIVYTIETA